MTRNSSRRTFLKQAALATAAACCGSIAAPARGADSARRIALADARIAAGPIDVGDRTQFMLDDLFIERGENVRLEINPPRKAGMVLAPERPWEEHRVSPDAVLEDSGVYKMWYGCVATYTPEAASVTCPRCKLVQDGRIVVCTRCGWPTIGVDRVQQEISGVAYAESKDGIHWERPVLGLREFRGSKENNLVPGLSGVAVPAINPRGPSDQRFMCFVEHGGKLWIATSPDGLRWTRKPKPALPFSADTNNQILFDPGRGKYVAFLRGFPGRRVTMRCEFDSLDQSPLPFTEHNRLPDETGTRYITDEMEIVLDRDADDPPISLDMNNLSATLYAPGVYLGVVGVFRHYPGGVDARGRQTHRYFVQGNDGVFCNQLATSRDGRRWLRPDRRDYVPYGAFGSADGGFIMVAPGIVARGDELYQYYFGQRATHGIFRPGFDRQVGAAFRLVQDKDRFVGLTTCAGSGHFVTPPIRHDGHGLQLNIDCGGLGATFVAILDAAQKPIAGFGREDCDPIDLNQARHTVSWRGNADLRPLAGRPIRLEFFMRSSKLYTFRFAKAEG